MRCRLFWRRWGNWRITRNRRKGEGIIQAAGCVNSQKTHLMYALGDGCEYRVIAFSSEEKAKKAYDEYRFLTENVYMYPARDLLFYHADIKGKLLTVLRALLEKAPGEEITVITTMDAFLDGLPHPEEVHGHRIRIAGGDTVDFTDFQSKLAELGYERESQIEGPGQFAVRGGILDVFPLTEELPVRIELWGDEIDSIRSFDVESQRSVENLEEVTIYPASENWEEGLGNVSFLDYFPREKTLLFLDEPLRLQEEGETVEKEYFHSRESRMEAGMEEEEEGLTVFETRAVIEKMNRYSGFGFTTLESKCGMFKVRETYSIQTTAWCFSQAHGQGRSAWRRT